MAKRKFNDDYYCQSIRHFEDDTFADRYWGALLNWTGIMAIPMLMVGQAVAGSDWRRRIAVVGGAYALVVVCGFIHEINEYVRYVRHQLRVHREAVHEVAKTLAEHRNRENFTVADAVEFLDGEVGAGILPNDSLLP